MDRAGRPGRLDLTASPAAPEAQRVVEPRWRWIGAYSGAFLVLTALVLLRQAHLRSWETIWAEDGLVFAHDAGDGLRTLFRGYAGYANLAPRLLALPTAVLPVGRFAGWLAVSSAAFDVALALFVFRMSVGVIRSVWLRGLLLCMTALTPVLYIEANASVANVNWTLLFAAFWAVMAATERRSDIVLRAAVIFVAITSTPLAVLLLPLAVLTSARRRTRAHLVVLGAFAVGAAIQLASSLTTVDTTPAGVTQLSDLGPIFATRVTGSLLVGEQPLADLWRNHGMVFAVGALVIVGVILALLAIRAEHEGRLFAAVAVVHAVILFAVPIALRGSKAMRLGDGAFNLNGSRYLVTPLLLLLTAVAVLVDRQRSGARAERSRVGWLRGVLVAHGLVLIVTSYGLVGRRAAGPGWVPTVQAAKEMCRAGAKEVSFMLISPGLYMQLDCDRIDP